MTVNGNQQLTSKFSNEFRISQAVRRNSLCRSILGIYVYIFSFGIVLYFPPGLYDQLILFRLFRIQDSILNCE